MVSPSTRLLPSVITAFSNTVTLLLIMLLAVYCRAMYRVAMLHIDTVLFCGATAELMRRPPHCGGFHITHTVGRLWTSDQLPKKPAYTTHNTTDETSCRQRDSNCGHYSTKIYVSVSIWFCFGFDRLLIHVLFELINWLNDNIGRNGTRK
jgi:hypothetical protein